MAKIAKVQEVDVDLLRPYGNNAKVHGDDQVEKLCRSIREFGFISPCLIDSEHNVIAGHGRILAAKKLGMKKVPCLFVEGLSEEQRRAYTLADNRLTELGEWNMEMVQIEIGELEMADFDVSLTGFDEIKSGEADWFSREEKDWDARQEGNDEYNAFLDKFEAPKTTDDCYTPDNVYDAVADWVAKEWDLDRKKFMRPFYPGGDYQKEHYQKDAVVVDNPPFSILSEIIRWYCDREIKFFLFGPTLTLFTAVGADVEYMPIGVGVLYENGATVNTSFIDNIGNSRIYLSPTLYKAVFDANQANEEAAKKNIPKFEYPPEAMLSARLHSLAKYGQELRVPKNECVYQGMLDAQKENGKQAFGGLFLVSERVAAEHVEAKKRAEIVAAERAAEQELKAANEAVKIKDGSIVWELSERERAITQSLGKAGGSK